MREQYQQEMQKIHVPESLLIKTKLAMKEEEQRIKSLENERKVIPFGRISVVAAAAVILLVCVPVISSGKTGVKEADVNSNQKQIYLAGREEAEMIQIEPEESESNFETWLKEVIEKLGELFE